MVYFVLVNQFGFYYKGDSLVWTPSLEDAIFFNTLESLQSSIPFNFSEFKIKMIIISKQSESYSLITTKVI